MSDSKFNRRRFLQMSALGTGSALLAACAAPAAAPGAAPAAAATTAPAAAAGAEAAAGTGALEIFSWWTSGGEVEALNAIYEIFSAE
jgi:glucose/mannose transport system substrate-binding protein